MTIMETTGVDRELVKYVEESILPKYDAFDAAHRRDHIEAVISASMKLAPKYDVRPDMVYAIAAYHDLGIVNGRERHHLDSGTILEADTRLRQWFTQEEIAVMKEAVEDHRASAESAPRSVYGMIVAEADRNIDLDVIVRRAVQYGLDNFPQMNRQEQYGRVASHVRRKYGTGGYLKLWIPESDNAVRLREVRKVVDDDVKLRALFDRYYDEYAGKA